MKIAVKVFKSLLRILLMLTYALVVIVIGAVLTLGYIKDIHIKKVWIDAAIARFAPDDIKLQAESIDLHLLNEGFWQKRVTLSIKDACFSYQDPAVHLCFSQFDWAASGRYKSFKPALVNIAPLHLLGAEVSVDLDAFQPSPGSSPPSDFSFFDLLRKQILPHWNFAGSQVDIKSAHIKSGSSLYGFRAILGANDGELHIIIPDVRDLKSGDLKADLEVLAYIPEDLTTSNALPWHVRVDGHVAATGKNATLSIESDIRSFDDVTYSVKANIRKITLLRKAEINGTYKGDDVKGVASIQLGGYGTQVKQVNFVSCAYAADLDKKTGQLQCGPQSIVLSLAEHPAFRNSPELFTIRPTLLLKFTDVSFKKGLKAKADMKVDLNHLNLVDFHFHAGGDVDTSGRAIKYDVKAEAGANVLKFQRLVKILRTTPFAVPAPLNVMKGHIAFGMHGKLDQDGGLFPFEFSPDLRSETQRMLLSVGGSVKIKNEESGLKTHLEIDTAVQALSLAAPRLDLAALPQLQPDSRFATPTPVPLVTSRKAGGASSSGAGSAASGLAATSGLSSTAAVRNGVGDKPLNAKPSPTPSSLTYNAKVHTTSPGAIQLQTNLTKNNIPISIELTGTSQREAIIGTVDIGHTAIELFHRKAEVNDIALKLRPDGTQEVNAKLTIRYLDYTIFVYAQGGVSDPNIHLESDPPLEQNDIISVLLYGRTADDLDPAQTESVSNTNTAITDKAVGIASLFLLASTPIESVAYNSQTHSVTARIGLGHGTSLDVGSGSQVVGVRHRLGKHWILSSYVEKDQVTQENAVDAFVEWVRLF